MDIGLTLRFWRGNHVSLALTAAAVACGVGQIGGNDLVAREALRGFTETISTMAGQAALQVTAGEDALFAQDAAVTVAAVPGVQQAVPVIGGSVFTADDTGELLTVQGMDLGDDAVVNVYELHGSAQGTGLDDPRVLLPDAIVVTKAFAERRGLAIGDSLALDTPRGQQTFTIRALLDPRGLARVYSGNLIVMDLANAQALFADDAQANRIDVVVGSEADIDQVADAIRARLPPGLRVERPRQRQADLNRVIWSFRVFLWAISAVGLVGSYLVVFNSLTTLFEARTWQLGLLRAIGVRSRQVWFQLVGEGFAIGLVGSLLGIPLAIAIAHFMLPRIIDAVGVNSNVISPRSGLTVHAAPLVAAVGLGLLASVTAAALPAWRAARAAAADTLRARGTEQAGGSVLSHWLMRCIVSVTTLLVVCWHWSTRSVPVGVVATPVILITVALWARPLIDLLCALWHSVGPLGSPTSLLAVQNIVRNRRHAALTVATVGTGLACVLWLWTVAGSFEASVIDATSEAMRADFVVTAAHIEAGLREAAVSGALLHDLRAIPGVAMVVGTLVIEWHYAGERISVDAADPEYFTTPDLGQWPLHAGGRADVWPAVARGEAAVVSSNFVRNIGLGVGDTLALDTPTGPLRLPIAGVVTHFASARGTISISRQLVEQHWGEGRVTRAFVRLAPGADAPTVRAAIAAQLGRRYRLRILTSPEIVAYFTSQVRRAFSGVYVIAVVMVVMVLAGMANTMAAGVLQRTREIGALRFVGVQRHHVRKMVLIESLILGVVGFCLAAIGGWLLGLLWVKVTFPALLGWLIEVKAPFELTALLALAAITVCCMAAILPARRAAMLQPAAALRYE